MKAVSGIMLTLLLIGMLALAFHVQPVKAELGTIYIMPDGSITPSTANITTSDKVTYTFTGNNYLPIVVNRSNIIINGKGHTLQASGGTGFSLTDMSNVTIKNTTITNSNFGIYLSSSSGNVLSDNKVTASSTVGIFLEWDSDNNTLVGNIATGLWPWAGIYLYTSCDYNTLSGNNVTENSYGIIILYSSDNVLSDNNVANNGNGITFNGPLGSDNKIFHNNFLNNLEETSMYKSNDTWDDGYPSGGNYWSDYSGVDQKSGPYQNVTGSDGIGDTPYVIDANNTDRYPLMKPWLSGSLSVAISPPSATMDVGQFQLFTAIALGGTPPDTYQWCLNSAAVSGANSSMWKFKPSSTGSYTVYFNVTDNTGLKAKSSTASVTVNPMLSVGVSPSSSIIDYGQHVTLSSSVTGGTSPYTYEWYLNSSVVTGANSSSWTFTPSSTGSYSVYVKVTDSASIHVTAQSNTASVTVNSESSITISPASVTMDVGQSQQFTSSVSGGTSPYTYQWYLNGTAISGATSSSYTFTPSSRGHYNFYCNVTDSANARAQSNTATVVVNSALSVSVSPASVTMDFGQSQVFTSSVTGGTSAFTYHWFLNGTVVSGATSSTWTFSPSSSGSYLVYVEVTDNVGVQATSNTASVTVNGALSVSVSPSSVVMDVGQSQTFTATVTGGTAPYTYQWYLNGSAISGATSSSYTYTPSSSGSHTIYVKSTDNASTPVTVQSSSSSITVNSALSISISPTSVTLDVGQSQTFTSSVSGGTSSYSYQWYLDGGAVSGATSSSWTYSPSSSGSHSVYVKVTDSASTPNTAQSSSASVTVNPALSVSISPTSVTMDAGQSQTFASSVSGGTSLYSYQWYLDGSTVSGATSSSWTYSPSSSGSHYVYVKVTDSASTPVTAQSNAESITVNSALSVSISPTSVTLDVGQSQTFTSSVSGGTSSYSYQWYLDGIAVSGATSSSWTYSPSSSGSHSVYVKVTDSASTPNTAQSSSASVTVNPVLSVSISPTSVTMDVGQSKTFTSSVSGGMSPYTYQWYENGTAVSGATSSTWTFTPSSPGSSSIYVNITDNAGFRAESNIASVTVNSPSSSPLLLSASKMILYVSAAIIIIAVVAAAVVLRRRKKQI
jgi:parallel beta-helix repeat protein